MVKEEDTGMDSEELAKKICLAHAEYCKSRKNKPCGCAGQTTQNLFTSSKCYRCPYYTEYSCAVKFAVEYLRKNPFLEKSANGKDHKKKTDDCV